MAARIVARGGDAIAALTEDLPVEREITAWSYSTEYFGVLTRGLANEGMKDTPRYLAMIVTVPSAAISAK